MGTIHIAVAQKIVQTEHYFLIPLRFYISKTGNTRLLTYLLTSLLTPWSRVLLEKLTGSQLVKKFPAFYGTRRFITAFTRACHLSQSYVGSSSPLVSFPQVSPPKPCIHLCSPPYMLHTLPISFFLIDMGLACSMFT